MTYNELRKKVKEIHGGLPMDIAIHQSRNNNKMFTDIIVSSLTDFVKYSYHDKELCFTDGKAYIGTIDRMKTLFTQEDKE